jgi:hypothetical protein
VSAGAGSVALGVVATEGEVEPVDAAPELPPPESSPQAAKPSAKATRMDKPERRLK